VGTPPPPEKDSHPNRGTLGVQRTDRMWLSADQLADDESKPSWRAPKRKGTSRFTPARIGTIAILLIILALVIVLKATGSI
jgi:hypothetical protein